MTDQHKVKIGDREMTFEEARAAMDAKCAEVLERMFPDAAADPEVAQKFAGAYAGLYRQQHGRDWTGEPEPEAAHGSGGASA